jgi:multicomponent Na+:H+ antiporter subunit C
VLIACGIYLVLERTLTRIILGFVLLGNGINLLYIMAAGTPGIAPFEGDGDPADMTDPLPFAMVLTAIVITLGVTAFGVALAYRAWQLFGHDEVADDVEDRRVLRRSRKRTGQGIEVAWTEALDEESRRGALARSQAIVQGPTQEDPLGSDLSGVEDVPWDRTEADEDPDADPVASPGGDRDLENADDGVDRDDADNEEERGGGR